MDERLRRALHEGEALGARYALAPPERAPTGVAGARLGHRPGSSLEFMEHRDYQPGDDLRTIDWAAYARTDRLTVKRFREEVSPNLDVVVDGSRSMDLPESEKARGAAMIASLLTTAAANAGFHHRVYHTARGFEPIPGSAGRAGGWAELRFDGALGLDEAFAAAAPRWPRQGVRVVISDLLFPGDPAPLVRRLAADAAALHVVQLAAEADRQPPRRGNVRLLDSETGAARELYLDAATQQRYREALARHEAAWGAACRSAGARLTPIVAERIVAGELLPLVEAGLLSVA